MEKYHGFFTYVGETSRYQIHKFNHGERKSITLKNGVKFSRFKNGHTLYVNNHKLMKTSEYVFVNGKFRSVFPAPKYVGIDMGESK